MRKLQLAVMNTELSKEKVLREVPWMSRLSEDTFAILVEAAKEKIYPQDSYLVRQGESDDSVYLVVRGIVQIVEEYGACLLSQIRPTPTQHPTPTSYPTPTQPLTPTRSQP